MSNFDWGLVITLVLGGMVAGITMWFKLANTESKLNLSENEVANQKIEAKVKAESTAALIADVSAELGATDPNTPPLPPATGKT